MWDVQGLKIVALEPPVRPKQHTQRWPLVPSGRLRTNQSSMLRAIDAHHTTRDRAGSPHQEPIVHAPAGGPSQGGRRATRSAANATATSKPTMTMLLSVVSNVPELPFRREGSPRRCNGAAFPFREFA